MMQSQGSDIPRSAYLSTTSPREGTALHSVASGLFAGLVFAVGQSLTAIATGRSVIDPLPFMGLVLHRASEAATYTPLFVVGGIFVHFAISILFACAFFAFTGSAWRAGAGLARMMLLGSLFGALVWVINVLLFRPLFFPESAGAHQGWEGFLAHVFLYGTVLGLYAGVIPRRAETYPRNG